MELNICLITAITFYKLHPCHLQHHWADIYVYINSSSLVFLSVTADCAKLVILHLSYTKPHRVSRFQDAYTILAIAILINHISS